MGYGVHPPVLPARPPHLWSAVVLGLPCSSNYAEHPGTRQQEGPPEEGPAGRWLHMGTSTARVPQVISQVIHSMACGAGLVISSLTDEKTEAQGLTGATGWEG